jgi:hypothetical protein
MKSNIEDFKLKVNSILIKETLTDYDQSTKKWEVIKVQDNDETSPGLGSFILFSTERPTEKTISAFVRGRYIYLCKDNGQIEIIS